MPTSDVLLIFNNPKSDASAKVLTRLSQESKRRSAQENSAGSGGGAGSGGSAGGRKFDGKGASGKERSGGGTPGKGGEVDESYINSGESELHMCTCTLMSLLLVGM